jgi:hypothetical protein
MWRHSHPNCAKICVTLSHQEKACFVIAQNQVFNGNLLPFLCTNDDEYAQP